MYEPPNVALIARANWEKSDEYPSKESMNSEVLAWEFLRRNAEYAYDYEAYFSPTAIEKWNTHVDDRVRDLGSVSDEKREQIRGVFSKNLFNEQERLRLKWEITDLISPATPWSSIHKNKFYFLANLVDVFDAHLSEPARFDAVSPSTVNRYAKSIPIWANNSQILVRISIDGNLENQISDLKDKLRRWRNKKEREFTLTGLRFSAANCELLRTDKPTKNRSMTEDVNVEIDPISMKALPNSRRVSFKGLIFALRAIDAFASLKFSIDNFETLGEEMRKLSKIIRAQFLAEQKPDISGRQHQVRQREVISWINYGMRYTLGQGYLDLASSAPAKKAKAARRKIQKAAE